MPRKRYPDVKSSEESSLNVSVPVVPLVRWASFRPMKMKELPPVTREALSFRV
jgi:hypothetical protein